MYSCPTSATVRVKILGKQIFIKSIKSLKKKNCYHVNFCYIIVSKHVTTLLTKAFAAVTFCGVNSTSPG